MLNAGVKQDTSDTRRAYAPFASPIARQFDPYTAAAASIAHLESMLGYRPLSRATATLCWMATCWRRRGSSAPASSLWTGTSHIAC